MRIKRFGPGQYAMVGRRREDGKLAKREKAEAEMLAQHGLEAAAKLYGITVHLEPQAQEEMSIADAQRELGVLQSAGRPFRMPGHYGKRDRIRDLLIQAGVIKT